MRPFFTYSGGKWRAAHRYPDPEFSLVVEPFAGSAGYAIRHHEREVLLIDADPRVVSLWAYLIAATPSEILDLPLYQGECRIDELDLPVGARLLIGSWINKGSPFQTALPSKWFYQYPLEFWGPRIRQRIADQVLAIKHWKIEQGDYACAPDVEATWFIDPPYQRQGPRTYTHFSLDYDDLGVWSATRYGQVIACEGGGDWLPFQELHVSKSMHGAYRTGRSTEYVYLGGLSVG